MTFFRRWEKPALFLRYQNIDGYQTHGSTQIIAFSKLLLEDFKSSLNFVDCSLLLRHPAELFPGSPSHASQNYRHTHHTFFLLSLTHSCFKRKTPTVTLAQEKS